MSDQLRLADQYENYTHNPYDRLGDPLMVLHFLLCTASYTFLFTFKFRMFP